MQYYKPAGEFYVGDCMPFFHEDTFHLYYLLDEKHHQSKGGLGAHQWAHACTRDLVHWEHHPLALPITADWEGSICTGSVFHHNGTFYAYYATRMPDRTQHLCVATSTDGIHFDKSLTNPFASPGAGYAPRHYRDPCLFRDERTGLFHMLVTASLEDYPLHGHGGCLAHLVSRDLESWQVTDPFLIPGYTGTPECPDYFAWNDWTYLLFSIGGIAHYRMSRSPLGPWIRPPVDVFDGPMACVLKTAAFGPDRRIGVAYLPSLRDDADDGDWLYAGNALFREIVQHDDGCLGCAFPPEMIPSGGAPLDLPFTALTGSVSCDAGCVHIHAPQGLGVGMVSGVPQNARITCRLAPGNESGAFGLCVRASGAYESGYQLRISPYECRVELGTLHQRSTPGTVRRALSGVKGLGNPITLDVVLVNDIVDVCIDGRHCLASRYPELRGDRLFFFCHDGDVVFDSVEIRPLV